MHIRSGDRPSTGRVPQEKKPARVPQALPAHVAPRARKNRLRSCVRRGKAKLRGIGRARKIIVLENYVIRGIPEFASGVIDYFLVFIFELILHVL